MISLQYDEIHQERGYCSDTTDIPRCRLTKAYITDKNEEMDDGGEGCGGCCCCVKIRQGIIVTFPIEFQYHYHNTSPVRDSYDTIIRRCLRNNKTLLKGILSRINQRTLDGKKIPIPITQLQLPKNPIFKWVKHPASTHLNVYKTLYQSRQEAANRWKRTYSCNDDVSSTDVSSDWWNSSDEPMDCDSE